MLSPPDYLLRTGVVIDDLRLLYAPVPKAVSTSILGALAETVGIPQDRFARSRKPEATRAQTVHDGSLWGPSYRLWGKSPRDLETALESDDWFRFTVVREPARRVWSAWVSKVLVRDPRFVEAFGEEWFPAPPSSSQDVLEAFRTFVCEMPGQVEWHDPHWSSQADLVGVEGIAYGHVGRAEQLDRTVAVLSRYVESRGGRLPALRIENPSVLPFSPGLFDRRAREACNLWTARDRESFDYPALTEEASEPDPEWHDRVRAGIPGLRAVIERNGRIADLWHMLEDEGDTRRRLAIQRLHRLRLGAHAAAERTLRAVRRP